MKIILKSYDDGLDIVAKNMLGRRILIEIYQEGIKRLLVFDSLEQMDGIQITDYLIRMEE